jgi:hypothetical protein
MGATAVVGGMAIQAYGRVKAGKSQQAGLDSAAAELQQEAGQSVASGIQGAIQDRRRAAYVASDARARTAAGGFATTGTSAIANVGQIRGEGEYRALTSLYQGEDRASELDFRGGQMRTEGSNAVRAGWLAGMSNVLSVAGSPAAPTFFSKNNVDNGPP